MNEKKVGHYTIILAYLQVVTAFQNKTKKLLSNPCFF